MARFDVFLDGATTIGSPNADGRDAFKTAFGNGTDDVINVYVQPGYDGSILAPNTKDIWADPGDTINIIVDPAYGAAGNFTVSPGGVEIAGSTPPGYIELNGGAGDVAGQTFSGVVNVTNGIYVPPNGIVSGTSGDDLMGVGYTDADGDRVDNTDNTIAGGAGNDSLSGGDGNDVMDGGVGNDTVDGDAGADTISGGAGNDLLRGGAGDDRINNFTGNDTVFGGAGNDTIIGGFDNDLLDGGDGADTFAFDHLTGVDTVIGGEGGTDNDVIDFAPSTAAVTVTFNGDEAGTYFIGGTPTSGIFSQIEGVIGSQFDDIIDASAAGSAQTLWGRMGDDTLTGGSGNDTLTGGAGADSFVLIGDAGADLITDFDFGDDDSDGFTNDQLDVSELTSGDGTTPVTTDDVVISDTNGDGSGDAILTFPGGESITLQGVTPDLIDDPAVLNAMGIPMGVRDGVITGTEGFDFIMVGNGQYLTDPDVVDGNDNLAGNNDDLIHAGGGNDQIYAQFGNDTVFGGDGNDFIAGGSGDDLLYGEQGNDRFMGSDGADTIDGGDGIDTIAYFTDSAGVNINLAAGTSSGGLARGDVFTNIENIDGGSGADTLTGDAGDNIIRGNAGNDLLFGGGARDLLSGDAGNDSLYGEQGNDQLEGGADDDLIEGGDGSDQLFGGTGNDALVGGTGNDLLFGGAGADTMDGGEGVDWLSYSSDTTGVDVNLGAGTAKGGDATGDVFSNVENLNGGLGNDWLTGDAGGNLLSGLGGDDTLDGGSGNDTLDGGIGNDVVQGGEGADYLMGRAGSDSLKGDKGNDTLNGGNDDDALTGGDGNDVFIVSSGQDVILDFNTGSTGSIADGDQGNNDFVDLSGYYSQANYDAAVGAGDIDPAVVKNPLQWMRADQEDDGILNDAGAGWTATDTLTLKASNSGSQLAGADLSFDNTNVVCFARGTRIRTSVGEVLIEDLAKGDMVQTMDNGNRPLRWIGSTRLDSIDLAMKPKLKPVCITAGALGQGMPATDLRVSPQHRVLLRSVIAERMFKTAEVLIPAIKLTALDGIYQDQEAVQVEYFHMLFDHHEIIFSNGAATESLFAGPEALKAVSAEARAEILTLFPEIKAGGYAPRPARPIPAKGMLMKQLVDCHAKNGRTLVDQNERGEGVARRGPER